MPSAVLGLDIGGANLKAAHTQGTAHIVPFQLWKSREQLSSRLRTLCASQPGFALVAATMTGELCDCYETRRQGVHAILDALEKAGDVPVLIWQIDGALVRIAEARSAPWRAAAANWLALAEFAGRWMPCGPGLVVDVGSTTTDVIPLIDGRPAPAARMDADRLRTGELVYSGARRTPICALLGARVAAEFFATMLDAYLVLGEMAEEPECLDTADGRSATRANAFSRLARMYCGDAETIPTDEIHALARMARRAQLDVIGAAIATVIAKLPAPPQTIMICGSGEFVARAAIAQNPVLSSIPVLSLAGRLGSDISQAACAYALASLAAERCLP
jgi:probable H4MPT-linked C1 transfer pathway protein